MKSWLQNNYIETYSIHNEENPLLLKSYQNIRKSYKCLLAMFKNVYINKLDSIFNKYHNTCHRTIEMKPTDVNLSTFIDVDLSKNKKQKVY